ncbi:MAG: family transposase [Cypionkella sp.]|nr:family transposase [Cypionkella sp.]
MTAWSCCCSQPDDCVATGSAGAGLGGDGRRTALTWDDAGAVVGGISAKALDGFGYAWFCEHFNAWNRRMRPMMRQAHVGGKQDFVDFASDTIDVIDPDTARRKP